MIRYDYIFCDLDGPILDGKYRHYKCYCDILINKYKMKPLPLGIYWSYKRSGMGIKKILNGTGINEEHFLIEWKKNIERREVLVYDTCKPEIDVALKYLKSKTKYLYVVTMRSNYSNLLWELKNNEIYSYFDEVICCKNVGIESKYCRLKQIHFNNALLIGDTEVDIYTAKKLDCNFIGISNGLRSNKIFEQLVNFEELIDIYKDDYLGRRSTNG